MRPGSCPFGGQFQPQSPRFEPDGIVAVAQSASGRKFNKGCIWPSVVWLGSDHLGSNSFLKRERQPREPDVVSLMWCRNCATHQRQRHGELGKSRSRSLNDNGRKRPGPGEVAGANGAVAPTEPKRGQKHALSWVQCRPKAGQSEQQWRRAPPRDLVCANNGKTCCICCVII